MEKYYKKNINLTHGFSLIEIIVSLGIFSFILVFLTGVFLSVYVMNNFSLETARATNFANEKIISLKLKPYVEIVNLITTPSTETVNRDGVKYNVNISGRRLSTVITSPEYNLIELTVELHWHGKKELKMGENQVSAGTNISVLKMQSVISPGTQY